jgi:hypothetical protein
LQGKDVTSLVTLSIASSINPGEAAPERLPPRSTPERLPGEAAPGEAAPRSITALEHGVEQPGDLAD